MKIGIVPGVRYYKVNGQYYTTTSYHKDMWSEYFEVFDDILILAQSQSCENIEDGFKVVLDDHVEFAEYPWVKGLKSLFRLPGMFIRAYKAARKADVWLLHSPSLETLALWPWLALFRVPYALILRGEQSLSVPYLKTRGIKCACLVTWVFKSILWLHRSRALACVGVARFLAETYPPLRRDGKKYAISDSRIPLDMYRQPRTFTATSEPKAILCLGRIEGQKNPLGTMKALSELDKMGFTNWRFVWIGDGPLRQKTQQFVNDLGLTDRVQLLGFVPWEKVFEILDSADLYVLNSVSEGMPRSLLEAMACALPSIGTNICGIPELLPPEDMVPMREDQLLAQKMYEVLTDLSRLTRMSYQNVEKAKEYSSEALQKKQIAFYRDLKEIIDKD